MIKVNIIYNNKAWLRYIKNPNMYVERQIKNFNKRYKKYQKKKIYCTLLLSGNFEIKRLNKKFRKRNKSTDVLSFPFYKKKDLRKKLKFEKEIYIGDIIISLNKIKNKKDKKIFKLEFDKLWIHGLLHLFGYDHKKNEDYNEMSKLEKKFLSYLK